MFLSHLKIALRNFLRHRIYSVINLLGLAVSLGACLLITLYIADESSYDRQHPDATRIYRFSQTYTALDEPIYLDTAMPQTGPLLQQRFVEVEEFARMLRMTRVLSDGEGNYTEERLQLVDPTISGFIGFDWLQGDPATALTEPFSVVLTETLAHRYFGAQSPLGKTLQMGEGDDDEHLLQVTGVVADLPRNTTFTGQIFLSMSSAALLQGQQWLEDWNNVNFATYLKLQPQADMRELEPELFAYLLQSMPEKMRGEWDFSTLKLTDIHLHAPLPGPGQRSSGNYAKLLILTTIGAGLLLIAAINFVNLSTARSLKRSTEVAVRKAIGSSRRQLIQQFMGESCLMVVLAFLLAVALAEIALPGLNAFTDKTMLLGTFLASWPAVLSILALILLLALLAGAYPAFYLSSLSSATAAGRTLAGGILSFRNLLVIFQFAIAVVLVIAALVVQAQVQYGKNIELGFTKDQVLILEAPGNGSVGSAWPAFKAELLRHPGISAATAASVRPFEVFVSQRDTRHEGGEASQPLTQIRVDYDFFETYEVPLLAGRTFDEAYGSDRVVQPNDANPHGSGSFILNRAAVDALGWQVEEATGKWFEVDDSNDFSRTVRGLVVGVVENMRIDSLREAIKPSFYWLAPDQRYLDTIALRLGGGTLPQTLAYIDDTWGRFYPGQPISRAFVDDDFQALYEEEERFGQLLSAASMLTVLISCLGLFGLASFLVERKTKEIGVRKVMGGSVLGIVWLLTSEFSRLVLLSNIIAWPIAYLAMRRWLESFAYRVDLTPLIFIGSGTIALCIAWVTVGGIAAKAASAKPVLALRYE